MFPYDRGDYLTTNVVKDISQRIPCRYLLHKDIMQSVINALFLYFFSTYFIGPSPTASAWHVSRFLAMDCTVPFITMRQRFEKCVWISI
ncbi:hypothetical protein XELAEV_18047059mg [Xenopus laevis]|uniref:Uncharacterized protein n=1 Tax=Xenopus laevis TaxID=8355 RepID=A0A974BUC2_XENLA|nr:hypothetical protein XELAEV_18047059mg [Xenopus laevis]